MGSAGATEDRMRHLAIGESPHGAWEERHAMMMPENHKVISTLNHLIMTCKDGREGFSKAADGVKSEALKSIFRDCARQRTDLLSELQIEVLRLGGAPGKEDPLDGVLHLGWLNLKTALSGEDEVDVVEAAERGEDIAVQHYQAALKEDMPQQVRTILQRQYNQVKQAHDRISALKREKSGQQS